MYFLSIDFVMKDQYYSYALTKNFLQAGRSQGAERQSPTGDVICPLGKIFRLVFEFE